MGGNHGALGDVMTVFGPLASGDGFTLDGHRQVDDSTLSDHVAFLILDIKLIIGIN